MAFLQREPVSRTQISKVAAVSRHHRSNDRLVANVRRQFDAIAASWDAEHGPASARAAEFAARIKYLSRVCEKLALPHVLDLGCGTGQVLQHLAPVIQSGVGIDISSAMIERTPSDRQDGRLRFYIADAARFCSQCNENFDLLLLSGVLAHLPDQDLAFAGAKRVLSPKGRLIVISPHPWNPLFLLRRWSRFGREAPPARHLSPRRLTALAQEHGFRLTGTSALPYAAWSAMSSVLPLVLSKRAIGRGNPMLQGAYALEFALSVEANG